MAGRRSQGRRTTAPTPAPPPDIEHDELEPTFSIERVVEARYNGKRRQYLIKWAGFPDSDNTWELAEDLKGYRALLDAFEAVELERTRLKGRERRWSKRTAEQVLTVGVVDDSLMVRRSPPPPRPDAATVRPGNEEDAVVQSDLSPLSSLPPSPLSPPRKRPRTSSPPPRPFPPPSLLVPSPPPPPLPLEPIPPPSPDTRHHPHPSLTHLDERDPSWEDVIAQVLTIDHGDGDDDVSDASDTSRWEVVVRLTSGAEVTVAMREVRRRAPQRLLDFMFLHLTFRPESLASGSV